MHLCILWRVTYLLVNVLDLYLLVHCFVACLFKVQIITSTNADAGHQEVWRPAKLL